MLAETNEPFQHLNFHDGWWKNMITEDTWLGLALLSRLCHSIDSCAHRQVLQSLKLQKMLFGMSVLCQSVDTWISRSRLRIRRAILCYLYGVMFQIIATGKKKKSRHSQRSYIMLKAPVLPTLGSVTFITIVFEKQDVWWITSLISSGASTSSA